MPISMKLLQEIVSYLESRPLREVVALWNAIQVEYAADQAAIQKAEYEAAKALDEKSPPEPDSEEEA